MTQFGRSARCAAFLFGLLVATGHCLAVVAKVPSQQLARGAQVEAQVDVGGRFGVESDLAQASSMQETNAQRMLPIGPVKKAGIFFVRVIAPDKSDTVVCVLVTEAGGDRFVAESIAIGGRNPASDSEVPATLVERFATAVAKDDYAPAVAAAKKVMREWLPRHAVETTGTLTICILPVPGAQAMCLARIGDHLVDLSFEFADALIDEVALTAAEKKQLRWLLQGGRTVVDLRKLVRADRGVQKLIDAAAAGVNITEFVVKERGGNDVTVSVVGNNFVGLIDKTAVTLKLVR